MYRYDQLLIDRISVQIFKLSYASSNTLANINTLLPKGNWNQCADKHHCCPCNTAYPRTAARLLRLRMYIFTVTVRYSFLQPVTCNMLSVLCGSRLHNFWNQPSPHNLNALQNSRSPFATLCFGSQIWPELLPYNVRSSLKVQSIYGTEELNSDMACFPMTPRKTLIHSQKVFLIISSRTFED